MTVISLVMRDAARRCLIQRHSLQRTAVALAYTGTAHSSYDRCRERLMCCQSYVRSGDCRGDRVACGVATPTLAAQRRSARGRWLGAHAGSGERRAPGAAGRVAGRRAAISPHAVLASRRVSHAMTAGAVDAPAAVDALRSVSQRRAHVRRRRGVVPRAGPPFSCSRQRLAGGDCDSRRAAEVSSPRCFRACIPTSWCRAGSP